MVRVNRLHRLIEPCHTKTNRHQQNEVCVTQTDSTRRLGLAPPTGTGQRTTAQLQQPKMTLAPACSQPTVAPRPANGAAWRGAAAGATGAAAVAARHPAWTARAAVTHYVLDVRLVSALQ